MPARSLRAHHADWLALILLTGLGLGLRLYNLGRESMWLDEAGRVAIALRPLADIPHAVGVIELSPPLYHLLLHFWIRLAGSSDTAVRLFSAMLGIPTVPIAGLLGGVVGGRPGRLAMATIAATSPFAVHYGQEAAMYALLLPLGLIALLAALGVLLGPQPRRARWLAAYMASGTLALYTHYYAAFLLLSVLLVGVYHSVARRATHGVIIWVGAHVFIALLFAPWIPVFLGQARIAASVEDWTGVMPVSAVERWASAILADGAAGSGVPAVAILIGSIALGLYAFRNRGPLNALLVTLVALPLALAIAASGPLHSFRERGFLAVVGAPWALMAQAMIPGGRRNWLSTIGLILAAAIGVLTIVGLRAHYDGQKEDWRGAAALIAQEAGGSDPIFFVHYAGELALDRYLTSPQPRIGLPQDFDWVHGYTARYMVTQNDVDRRVPPALVGVDHAWAVLAHDQGRGSDHLVAALDLWGEREGEWSFNGVRVLRYARSSSAGGSDVPLTGDRIDIVAGNQS